MNHADKITKPLFVVQGNNDPRVPRPSREQIVATLRRTARPSWYLIGKTKGTASRKKKNADFQFYATILFVQKFLLR